ncbi:MAG: twin-arginine translocation signal domain-containing protein, partial [Halobacteria archaeon]|nr:twin-arginine translocation signal domain-containing protein [Halobacteria archaeon]
MAHINRRDFLKGIGATGAVGLAGCMGDGGQQQGGNTTDGGDGGGYQGPDVLNVIGYPKSGIQIFKDY